MKPKLYLTLAAIAAISIAPVLVAGCSTTSEQKAQSVVAEIGTTAAKLQAEEAAAEPVLAAVSGTNAAVQNDLSYAEAVTTDAETLAPLLSGIIGAIPATAPPVTTGS